MNLRHLKSKFFGPPKESEDDLIGSQTQDSEYLGSLSQSQEEEIFNPKQTQASPLGRQNEQQDNSKKAEPVAATVLQRTWSKGSKLGDGNQEQPKNQQTYKPRTMVVSQSCPAAMMRSYWTIEDFEVKKKLYEGAISRVLLAKDKSSSIIVAIKVYKRAKLNDIERYQIGREIRMHSAMTHPTVIQFYAAWKDRDYVYIAIEWAPGGDVYNFLHKKGGTLTESAAINIIIYPFLNALQYLHSNGLIHRDIKPENILLDSALNIKLSDFGLSIDQTQEIANTRLGTPDYLAPEILHCPVKQGPLENKDNPNSRYNHRVDCWSVGVLAYELLVGSAPFNASSVGDTLRNIQSKEPKYPSSLSPLALDFIQSCLQKEPENRPDVADLLKHEWIHNFLTKPSTDAGTT